MTEDPRMDRDKFRLMPWARESEQAHGYNGKRPSARRQSGRATLDDDPQRADGEQTTLPETNRNREEAGGGGE